MEGFRKGKKYSAFPVPHKELLWAVSLSCPIFSVCHLRARLIIPTTRMWGDLDSVLWVAPANSTLPASTCNGEPHRMLCKIPTGLCPLCLYRRNLQPNPLQTFLN